MTIFMRRRVGRRLVIPPALVLLIVLAGCGGEAAVPTGMPTAESLATATDTALVGPTAATGDEGMATESVATKQAGSSSAAGGDVDCAAVIEALSTVNFQMQLLLSMNSDEQWANLSSPDSPVKLEPDKFRAAVETLSTLPDPVDGTFKKPSEVIPRFREMADLLDAATQSGKPFSDGSGTGPKIVALVQPLFMEQTSFTEPAEQAGCTS